MFDTVCDPPATQETLSAVILDTLRATPLRPTDLVQTLCGLATPREIQNNLSDLLDEGAVVLGTDRLLRATLIAA